MRIRHCSPHPRKSARVLEDDVCVGGDANWNSLAGFSILRPSHPHSVLLGILVNVMFKLTLKV
ncbi:hypothetical protein ZOSMA_150G00100 [Zostera marina]|uniref:Uncharacterized protein n=1 Tax=Zostera marina TaxID=29655 RepID=A0A0K9PW50_ZOSMR|nr:hypothetical protein ZOSMA_150G00100 [Zostera marina]